MTCVLPGFVRSVPVHCLLCCHAWMPTAIQRDIDLPNALDRASWSARPLWTTWTPAATTLPDTAATTFTLLLPDLASTNDTSRLPARGHCVYLPHCPLHHYTLAFTRRAYLQHTFRVACCPLSYRLRGGKDVFCGTARLR